MPRTSSAPKRQQGAANHRDTRHENGLVGPGKRVQKQKSNGHLNGHAKSSESLPLQPPLPATPPPTNGHVRQAPPANSTSDSKMAPNGARRHSVDRYSESEASDTFNNPPVIAVNDENHRRIDVNAAKNPDVHRDTNLLALVTAIIKSCPLTDTIAILIVLLQLPPTFLTTIHLLFAILTFVPHSTSNTSGVTFQEIFYGLGTPSFTVMFLLDFGVFMVWIFLWSPFQDLALDFAQSVIALTLGGGTSHKQAGLKNIFFCLSVTGISRIWRDNNPKQSSIRALISLSTNGLLGSPDPDDPLEPIAHNGITESLWNMVQNGLGVHILTQGVARYVRAWLVGRTKKDFITSQGDPEAAKGPADLPTDGSSTQSPDDSSTSLINATTTKKKKKHSAQIRIQQPLWAALASTKIVVIKEYETSHAAVESAGTNATDINNLGNAPFDREAERIWITHIGSDSICFSTSYFPAYPSPNHFENSDTGVDKSKPFFVKVNGTIWQPTRTNILESDQSTDPDTRWEGEIFGLAPMSSYKCEFISTVDDTCLFSANVRTRQPHLDSAPIGLVPGSHTGRPGSPTTTLRTSIATAEAKLLEEKIRQKKERKEQRTKSSGTRREIEKLTNLINNSGNADDRLRQKVQQSNLLMNQAQDALSTLQSEIESMAPIPTDDASEYKNLKAAYQSQRDQYNHSRNDFNATKAANNREIEAINNDITSLQEKYKKSKARIAKFEGEQERIRDANIKGIDEAQRKAEEQQRKVNDRANQQRYYGELSHKLEQEISIERLRLDHLMTPMRDPDMYGPQAGSPTTSVPAGYADFSEGVPGMPPAFSWPNTAGLYVQPAYVVPVGQPLTSQQGIFRRGRSSSMLSNVSGFTQSSNEGVMHPQLSSKWAPEDKFDFADRKDSSGSGSLSGSTSAPGSTRDPKSPAANGNGKLKTQTTWGSGIWDDRDVK